MGGAVHQRHGVGRLVLAHLDDPGRTGVDDRDRVGVRRTARDAVDERVGRRGADDLAGGEGEGVRRGTLGDHADDLGAQPQQVADPDVGADAAAHADRDVDDVEVGDGLVQLGGVRRDALDEIGMEGRYGEQVALGGERDRVLDRLLEVGAVDDHLGAVRLGRPHLVRGVALRHDDRDRHLVRRARRRRGSGCGCPGSPRPGPRGGGVGQGAGHEVEPAPHLERAGRVVVLVLDPRLGAGRPLEQRPAAGGGGSHVRTNAGPGVGEVGEVHLATLAFSAASG